MADTNPRHSNLLCTSQNHHLVITFPAHFRGSKSKHRFAPFHFRVRPTHACIIHDTATLLSRNHHHTRICVNTYRYLARETFFWPWMTTPDESISSFTAFAPRMQMQEMRPERDTSRISTLFLSASFFSPSSIRAAHNPWAIQQTTFSVFLCICVCVCARKWWRSAGIGGQEWWSLVRSEEFFSGVLWKSGEEF